MDSSAARCAVHGVYSTCYGFCRLGLLLVAEFTLVLRLRGLSISEYLESRDPVAGTVYYLMLGVFAIMPLTLNVRQK